MTTSLRGSVAIVGMGETEVGALPGQGSTELCAEAARRALVDACLLYTSPSPRDLSTSRMPSSA